jgi:Tfp pilus assembly protein PilF
MDNDQQPESRVKRDWGLFMGGVGSVSALIGLCITITGGVTWYITHRNQHAESKAKMALAQAQAKQGEYQPAVQTYTDLLKADPLYRPALDQQLSTTMLWTENFSVTVDEGQSPSTLTAPLLDQIMLILDAGLTRSTGTQAADVQAHIGWAHWLNQHIAEREFGSVAEQNLRAALAADPSNVYANAMFGNWMTQTGGNLGEAIQHFNIAVSTGRVRPFVRTFQLSGLRDHDETGARAALVKALNDMRKGAEPVDEGDKRRMLVFCFDPNRTSHTNLVESLSAVPPDDAWQTYLWLDDQPQNDDYQRKSQQMVRDFITANLLEISGKRQESLDKYRMLRTELKGQGSALESSVNAALVRLSHS